MVHQPNVCRRDGYLLKRAEGEYIAQLKRQFQHGKAKRDFLLNKKRSGIRAHAEELARLSDPALQITSFTALKSLGVPGISQQLKLRVLVDGRREGNGKPLVRLPPRNDTLHGQDGSRKWLIYKLQALMKLEFAEEILTADPDDLCNAVPNGDKGTAKKTAVGAGKNQMRRSQSMKIGKRARK